MTSWESEQFDLKIFLVGESGVGKTCFAQKFANGTFKENHLPTVIADCYKKKMVLNDNTINLNIWHTSGKKSYKSSVKEYLKSADGVLLVYDVARSASLLGMSDWLQELRQINNEAIILIVGNKNDLPNKKVDIKYVREIIKTEGIKIFESSAKKGDKVEEVFEYLISKILHSKGLLMVNNDLQHAASQNQKESSSDSAPNGESKEVSYSTCMVKNIDQENPCISENLVETTNNDSILIPDSNFNIKTTNCIDPNNDSHSPTLVSSKTNEENIQSTCKQSAFYISNKLTKRVTSKGLQHENKPWKQMTTNKLKQLDADITFTNSEKESNLQPITLSKVTKEIIDMSVDDSKESVQTNCPISNSVFYC